MDPLSTTIVAALAAGATAALKEVAGKSVKDSYEALKRIIIAVSKRKATIEALEEAPESAAQQRAVAELLDNTGATENPAVIAKAKELTEVLAEIPPRDAAAYGLDIERFKASCARFKNIEANATAVRIRNTEVNGSFEAENIRGGKS